MQELLKRLVRLIVRLFIASAVLWMIISVPLPGLDSNLLVSLRVPLTVFVFIVYIGKTLYDTFFFERQP